MKPHTWTIETVDCGALGSNDFFLCSSCGAVGGHTWVDPRFPREPKAFINEGFGPPLDLPDDCEESQILIAKYRLDKYKVGDANVK